MGLYPVMYELRGRTCLVVGGGRIALRKTISLLRAEATVHTVAPDFHPRFQCLAERISMHIAAYADDMITSDMALVIGATDSAHINGAIAERTAALGIPCNIVDTPRQCTFFVPAVLRRGNLTVAISSGGTSPRLSRYLKQRIARVLGPEYSHLSDYLSFVRSYVRQRLPAIEQRQSFWQALFAADPVEYLQRYGWDAFRERTDRLVREYIAKAAKK